MRFRAEPSRHQDCRTVFASFARLNHSGPITFYAEMGIVRRTFQKDSARTVFHTEVNPSTHSSRAWESRTNSTQGHCSWHSLRRPRSPSALATRPGLFKRPRSSSRSSFFLLLLKIDGKPCFTLFFSPFSPKLGFQNLTEARIARTLTATLLSHSLWA